MIGYAHISGYTPLSYVAHIREISRSHMAYYHMKKAKKKTKGVETRLVKWKVTPLGNLSLVIRLRKPQFILRAEYADMLAEILASGKGLTKRDLDRVIERRKITLLDKEPPCTKVKVKL